MQMQDKIYRTNHKKGYYYMKKVGLCATAVIGASILLAIPVSIVRSILSNDSEMKQEVKAESFNSNDNIDLLKY